MFAHLPVYLMTILSLAHISWILLCSTGTLIQYGSFTMKFRVCFHSFILIANNSTSIYFQTYFHKIQNTNAPKQICCMQHITLVFISKFGISRFCGGSILKRHCHDFSCIIFSYLIDNAISNGQPKFKYHAIVKFQTGYRTVNSL